MKRSAILLLSILGLCTVNALADVNKHSHDKAAQATTSAVISPAANPDAMETRRILFSELAKKEDLPLRNADGHAMLNFGIRNDELVHSMTLHVRYMFSPALIPVESHVRVLVNDQAVGVLPILKDRGGDLIDADLNIDPRLLSSYNRISFDFIGHYTNDTCENPFNNTLWADIRGQLDRHECRTPCAAQRSGPASHSLL